MDYTAISADNFAATEGLNDWACSGHHIVAKYGLESFVEAAQFVLEIARAATHADHHPDISLSYPATVQVVLTTHAIGGLSHLDIELARVIARLAVDASANPVADH